jgi:hypothetical protein
MANYIELLLELLEKPPDPNEPLPVANKKSTIYGVAISFLVWIVDGYGKRSLMLHTDFGMDSSLVPPLGPHQGAKRSWFRRCVCLTSRGMLCLASSTSGDETELLTHLDTVGLHGSNNMCVPL